MMKAEGFGEELDGRFRDVLRAIVAQYVSTGEPVSSRALAKGGSFDLSPATLRNVMADLEDLGFLMHPHTSSGRVPTDRGYRYFINHLMKSERLSLRERDAIDGEIERTSDLDDALHLVSRLLSKLSDQVGVVFLPKVARLTIRSIDFILVAECRIMVVIVGTNGMALSRVIEINSVFSREELERTSNYLTSEFSGMTLVAIRDRLKRMMRRDRARYDRLVRQSVELGVRALEEVTPGDQDLFVEGAASILNKPEFAGNADALRKTLLAFEEKEKLVELLNLCIAEDGLHILVGSESAFTSDYNFSLVASRYGSAVTPVGIVGIIGPTRMEYGRVAPLVEYLGQVLSRRIQVESGEQR